MKRHYMSGARAGFTLVEVMLVVILIGVLSTIVVVRFSDQADRGRQAATRASIKNVSTAVELYSVIKGQLPGSLSDLVVSLGDNPPLIKNDMLRDAWGSDIQYQRKGEKEYEVRSPGPDHQIGTGDDLWL